MKSIVKDLSIGKSAAELYVSVAIDGKAVFEKRGDSLLAGFVSPLYSMMGNIAMSNDIYEVAPNVTSLAHSNSTKAITGATNASPIVITSSNHNFANGNVVQIWGVEGNTNANGFHTISNVTTNTFSLVGTTGNGTPDLTHTPGCRRWSTSSFRANASSYSGFEIRVGTSDQSVKINDPFLFNEVPSGTAKRTLELSAHNISQPAVGLTHSEITISRDFTNNSGETITINEVGMYARTYSYVLSSTTWYRIVLMARDLLNIPITSGSTITISYKIRTNVPTTDGGFLIQFNELLYRQLAQTSRESKDVFNNNQTHSSNSGQFYCASTSGLSFPQDTSSGYHGAWVGLQVGTSNADVVNTQFRLQNADADNTRIGHGYGSNQLIHYGTLIDRWFIDPITGEAGFYLKKLFENKSGNPITVRETGIYVGRYNGNISDVYCIARHRLEEEVVVENNEILSLQYVIKVTTNPA
jgi:hypothetical protein